LAVLSTDPKARLGDFREDEDCPSLRAECLGCSHIRIQRLERGIRVLADLRSVVSGDDRVSSENERGAYDGANQQFP
jgi:hypothetical protein